MEYNNLSLTAVFVEEPEGGYSAYIEEIKGVNTQGETIEEARENLKEALSMVLKANKELAEKNLRSNKKSIKEKMNLTA
ncbi:MAG: type II toxin-antitoxin system HicB family antitoxin [Prolixibacteraceae bacterium]|jgi:predicted RNase H-like HicB family nuclease|nr:type II toxin-antitoxin system HicB family antitoxin [Prolixibacteraceae bacterium]